MKKQYQKPMLAVEYFELTQSVAACVGIRIHHADADCIAKDPDATDVMKDFALSGFFLGNACTLPFYAGDTGMDGSCYHTSINSAFTS